MSDIKKAREGKGLSRKQLSEDLEIPYRTLQNWELELRTPPLYVERLIIKYIERAY